jgi:hypothetical protein
MLGVMFDETRSCRACGEGLRSEDAGCGACDGICGADCTFARRSGEMCCPLWSSGSATLEVSRVWETVVMRARRGRRNVGGSDDRVSRRAFRAERARRVIVLFAMVRFLLVHFQDAEVRLMIFGDAKALETELLVYRKFAAV